MVGLKVGLVIPTFNAGARWTVCLSAVKGQTQALQRRMVIDSGSTDGTVEQARSAGFEVVEIDQSCFSHGGTRQWAADQLADCEVLVFLTQDAIPAFPDAFSKLVDCFEDRNVAVAYGRQLPHVGATPIEAHSRAFSYGPTSLQKSSVNVGELGPNVFYCSNSFAAYRRALLVKLGGFRRDLILGEDMEFAARAVCAGYTNMYCAEAAAYHSHDYRVTQVLARYFDIGVFDSVNTWMRDHFGSHRGAGTRFILSELSYLWPRAPAHIPLAVLHTTAKLLGYRLGRLQRFLPKAVKRKVSLMPNYWR